MIFTPVNQVQDHSIFIENINIYIRLVEVFAERNKLKIELIREFSSQVINELVDMGLIQNKSDLILLKKIVGEDSNRLLNCVSFALKYKAKIGTLLDKLNNKKICTCVVGISPLIILNKTPFKNIHSALLLIDTTDEI